jgi:outer membrane biosynthesis protein TonB
MASEQAERLAAVLAEGVDGVEAFVRAGFTEQAAHCFADDPRVYLRKAGVTVDAPEAVEGPVAQPEPLPVLVPETAPEPEPTPVVEAEPEPTPDPEPTPEPEQVPEPEPAAEPVPEPVDDVAPYVAPLIHKSNRAHSRRHKE